jgi:hypothetical protein
VLVLAVADEGERCMLDGLRFIWDGVRLGAGSWKRVEGVRDGVGLVGVGVGVEALSFLFSSVMGDMGWEGSMVGSSSAFVDERKRILNRQLHANRTKSITWKSSLANTKIQEKQAKYNPTFRNIKYPPQLTSSLPTHQVAPKRIDPKNRFLTTSHGRHLITFGPSRSWDALKPDSCQRRSRQRTCNLFRDRAASWLCLDGGGWLGMGRGRARVGAC